jgi:integrase/recombinase XerD
METPYLFSSSISSIITRYIELKKALGRKFEAEYKVLKYLDSFLYTIQKDLDGETFAAWSHTKQHISPTTRRKWMQIIRNFCLYRQRTEPLCFVPNSLQFPKPLQPIQPYIFREDEILLLIDATQQLNVNSQSPLRRENFRLALVLFYTTGLRREELVRLTIGDYNPKQRTLLIRESKFHKSRLIPLSEDGWKEVESYLKIRRKRQFPSSGSAPLMWSTYQETGFYNGHSLTMTIRSLYRIVNIYTVNGRLPRLHDLRHTFAVHALLRWYHAGENVQAKLPFLSIYMGHVSIVSTAYYLSFIEEITGCASELFEKRYSKIVEINKWSKV